MVANWQSRHGLKMDAHKRGSMKIILAIIFLVMCVSCAHVEIPANPLCVGTNEEIRYNEFNKFFPTFENKIKTSLIQIGAKNIIIHSNIRYFDDYYIAKVEVKIVMNITRTHHIVSIRYYKFSYIKDKWKLIGEGEL